MVLRVHEEHVLLERIELLIVLLHLRGEREGLKADVREIVELEIEVLPFGGALDLLVAGELRRRRLHLLRAAAGVGLPPGDRLRCIELHVVVLILNRHCSRGQGGGRGGGLF